MLRTLSVFAVGVALALYGVSETSAQPGKGGPGGRPGQDGRGPGGPPDIKRLEAELELLRDQIKETEARLARVKQSSKGEAGKGKDEAGKGRDFGKGKEFGKGKDFGKGKEFGKGKDFGKGKGEAGKGNGFPFGGAPKLDPETIKSKYEFYKKLYEESRKGEKSKSGPPTFGRGFGKGPGFGKGFPFGGPMKKEATPPTPPAKSKGPGTAAPSGTRELEGRIERIERQLEEIRNSLKRR